MASHYLCSGNLIILTLGSMFCHPPGAGENIKIVIVFDGHAICQCVELGGWADAVFALFPLSCLRHGCSQQPAGWPPSLHHVYSSSYILYMGSHYIICRGQFVYSIGHLTIGHLPLRNISQEEQKHACQ